MDKLEQRKFELHAKTDEFNEKVRAAEQHVQTVFDRYENPHVEFSGGKDSLVTLHMVVDRCGYPDSDVFYFDNPTLALPGVTGYVETAVNEIGGTLIHRTGGRGTEDGGFWRNYRELHEERGWDVRVMGIRAAESNERRTRVDQNASLPITTEEKFDAVFPIHRWTATDVWAYIVNESLPYHRVYDDQAELYGGIDHRSNRLSMCLTRQSDSLGLRSVNQFLHPSKMNTLKNIREKN